MKASRIRIIALVIYVACIAIVASLIFGMSLGRYYTKIEAYADFGIANFNAVVQGEEDSETHQIKGFADGWDASKLYPGMTAENFKFTVSNGKTTGDVSIVGVSYQVVLRTTGNLPLKFRLGVYDSATHEYTYYKTGAQREFNREETIIRGMTPETNTVKWYEYSFYPDVDPASGNAAGAPTTEPSFYIEGGSLASNNHVLEVSWPISGEGDERTNQSKFMKEVDTIELLFNVTSRNTTYTSDAGSVVIDSPETYSDGVINIIPKNSATEKQQYEYKVDYIGFRQEGFENAPYTYNFRITNGYKYADKSIRDSLITRNDYYYTIELKTPVYAQKKDNDTSGSLKMIDISMLDYNLLMQDLFDIDGDLNTGEYIELKALSEEYRVYDELLGDTYGTYTVIAGENGKTPKEIYDEQYMNGNGQQNSGNGQNSGGTDPEELSARYRLYKVVKYTWIENCIYGLTKQNDPSNQLQYLTDTSVLDDEAIMRLINKASSAASAAGQLQFFKNNYQLCVSTADPNVVITNEYLSKISYNAYPEIIVHAQFLAAPVNPGGNTDPGTGSGSGSGNGSGNSGYSGNGSGTGN
ncbi:MAG: hypothetical protein MJ101_05440 [Clostridia bacterium]|nr:hypothetical protein [Clostridia bacterium]